MSTVHPTRTKATPLYYASLCGFCGLVEHLVSIHSQDVNSRGVLIRLRYMPPQRRDMWKSRHCSSKTAQILTFVTIWIGFHFTGHHRVETLSRRKNHWRPRGISSILGRMLTSPTKTTGLHFMRQHDLGMVTLQSCYFNPAQVSKFEYKSRDTVTRGMC